MTTKTKKGEMLVGMPVEGRFTKQSEQHIGTHLGKPIPAYIDTETGRYRFDRVAYANKRGQVPLAQMRNDEVVITPGLIYRKGS